MAVEHLGLHWSARGNGGDQFLQEGGLTVSMAQKAGIDETESIRRSAIIKRAEERTRQPEGLRLD